MAEITPGFRFYPTEEELVCFYLHNKLEGTRQDINCVIPMINVFDLEPWHLPKVSGELCAGETEQWFFFVPRQEREARGGRPCRITAAGYWKATGSPSYVYSSENKVIGLKKSMVFYKGKSPSGKKTKWKMNEYRAIEEHLPSYPTALPFPKLRHEMSLCRVYVILRNFGSFDRRPIIGNNMTSCRYTTIPSQEHVENRGSQQEVKMMMAIKCSESSVIVQEEDDDFDDDHHMMDVFATTGLTMDKSSEPFSGLERLIHF